MKTVLTLLTCLFILSPYVVLGSEDVVLVCEYNHTVDEKGVSTPTSGGDTFQISYLMPGTDHPAVSVKISNLGALFIGIQSKSEIEAETHYSIQKNTEVRQKLLIDRYSGRFSLSFDIGPPFSGGLVHFGRCESKKKLF